MIEVTLQDNLYKITFAYDPEYVAYCRGLQGARWNPAGKVWTAARTIPNAIALHASGYFHDAEFLNGFAAKTPLSRTYFRGNHQWNIEASLYAHQTEWSKWCNDKPRALCVAEQGLGKTLMALLWLLEFGVPPEQVLVVSPASLMFNWRAEVLRFTGEAPAVVSGTPIKRAATLETSQMHIINYELMGNKDGVSADLLATLPRKRAIIFDEVHYCKNSSSQRSKLAHKLGEMAPNVLGLTGTPVSQGAQDYYSQFKIIEPRLLGPSFFGFRNRYCLEEAVRGAPIGVTKITGYRRLEELSQILAPYTFTRLKKDCLDLPPKNYVTIRVAMGAKQSKAYKDMKRQFVAWVNSGLEPITQTNFLARMMKLAQICQGFFSYQNEEGEGQVEVYENPKLAAFMDFIDGLPDGEPVIVICRFRRDIVNVVTELTKRGITCDEIHGDVDHKDGTRQRVADSFQRRDYRVLVAQIASVAHGFTLTTSAHIVFMSNDFNLVNREQVEARIHRISQTRSVTYTDILCIDAVDEDIHAALTSKRAGADMLTDLRKKYSEDT